MSDQTMTDKARGGDRDYVAQQAAAAKAAAGKTAAALADSLKDGVDVRLWTKEYPWIAVGLATVAGFAAAAALVPTKEEQLLNRLRKIQEAVTPKPKAEKAKENGKDGEKAEHGGFGAVLREALAAARPAIVSLLSNMAAAAMTRPATDAAPTDVADPTAPPANGSGGPTA